MFEGPSSRRIEYRDLLDIFISDLTALFTVQEIFHEGQRRHIAFTPFHSVTQAVEDPQLRSRDFFTQVDHPTIGTLEYPGAPYRLSQTPWKIHRPAPRIGEHNRSVYIDELGLTEDEFAHLQNAGVI